MVNIISYFHRQPGNPATWELEPAPEQRQLEPGNLATWHSATRSNPDGWMHAAVRLCGWGWVRLGVKTGGEAKILWWIDRGMGRVGGRGGKHIAKQNNTRQDNRQQHTTQHHIAPYPTTPHHITPQHTYLCKIF